MGTLTHFRILSLGSKQGIMIRLVSLVFEAVSGVNVKPIKNLKE